MTIVDDVRAALADLRKRLVHYILSHRIRARHPTLVCHPTAIWDYGYSDIDTIEIGLGVSVAAFVEVIAYHKTLYSSIPGKLILGDSSVLATGVNVRAAGGTIVIGARSVLSQHTIAVAANHDVSGGLPYLHSAWSEERTGVSIGVNVWVGANCVLLPGCRIGDNAVIAAGSVVRGEVPPGEIWGGVPAKLIRRL